jgi:peptidoglycan/xylan/chitin deacetylase (PgdA/CDA1 family)
MNLVKRITGKAKRLTDDLIFNTGIGVQNRFSGINHFILMYHGVDKIGNTKFNSRHTSKLVLEQHIRFLKKHCHILSVNDFFERKFTAGKVNVAITFDDGLANNYTYAKPILEAYNAPATFYITGLNETEEKIIWADFLDIAKTLTNKPLKLEGDVLIKKGNEYHSEKYGKPVKAVIKNIAPNYEYKLALYNAFKEESAFKTNHQFDDYWKLMNDEQIKDMGKSSCISVGSHGFLHNNLGNIHPDLARKEISKSKEYLENLTQREVNSIAYPDGSYSRDLVGFCNSIGIRYNLAAEGFLFPEDAADESLLDRKGIYSCDSAANQLLCNFKKETA